MVKFQKDKNKITDALKKGLKKHRGSIAEVAKRTGYTRQYIYYVLEGKYSNLSILNIATKVFLEKEAEEKEVVKSIQQRLNVTP